MAIFVIALGAVMSALGVWAIVSGYGIVQVERGWAELIAGAAVLSGGIVTIALGFVLVRLAAIRDALLAAPPRAIGTDAVPPVATEPALVAEPVAPTQVAAPPAEPQPDWSAVQPSLFETAALAEAETVPDQPKSSPEPAVEAPREDALPVLHIEPERHTAPPPPMPAPEPARSPTATEADDIWRAVDAELSNTDWAKAILDAPVPEHHPAPVSVAEPAHAPSMPDPEPEPELRHQAAAQGIDQPADHAPVPERASAEDDFSDLLGERAATPSGSPPQVIGRYEAEGTTYTMYSDGSIDAQTGETAYHFSSMAELKAFIEQAT